MSNAQNENKKFKALEKTSQKRFTFCAKRADTEKVVNLLCK